MSEGSLTLVDRRRAGCTTRGATCPPRCSHGPARPIPAGVPGLTITPVAPGLWRVSRTAGAVLGHIELRDVDGLERYAVRRLVSGGTRSMPLGEFWSPRDAAECFR